MDVNKRVGGGNPRANSNIGSKGGGFRR